MDLLTSCCTSDINEVKKALQNKSYTKQQIDDSLKLVIETNNNNSLEITEMLLKSKPSNEVVDKLFSDSVYDGTNPELTYLLQKYCSIQMITYFHRYNQTTKNKLYVVGPIEEDNLKTLEKRKEFKEDKTIIERMKNQRKINDLFYDAYFNNNRLTAYRMLDLKRKKIPSQYTVNLVFSKCLYKSNYGFAEMLSKNNNNILTVDDDGINTAFENVINTLDIESIEWFFNNQHNIRPSQEYIEKVYFDFGIKKYQNNHSLYDFRERMTYLERQRVFKEMQKTQKQMEETLNTLNKYMPEEVINRLTDHIKKEQERQYRINRTFSQFHATEIHGYSQMVVKDDDEEKNENEENQDHLDNNDIINNENNAIPESIHQRRTLNNAILECITEKIKQFKMLSEDEVLQKMTIIIKKYLPANKHESSFKKIENLLNKESLNQFGSAILFLEKFHNDYTEAWIKGFMGESIDQHSCDAGVLERIVTGLRGINDKELNKIFSKAEAPQLLRVFLREGMNIFSNDIVAKSNVERILQVLVSKGLTKTTKQDKAKEYLENYIKETMKTFGLNPEEHMREADPIIDIIMDCYDTHLLPFIK